MKKTSCPLQFALLACLFALISSQNASAQWVAGGTSSVLSDTITVTNNYAYISGTFTASDPTAIYVNPPGYAHYYQITALTSTGTQLSSNFYMSDTLDYWPWFTLLDANLNYVTSPPVSWIIQGGVSYATTSFTLASGSTYYVEATSLGTHLGQFTLSITNVTNCIQVPQGTSGASIGQPSINGSLSATDAPSHARTGCYADYYLLQGIGSATVTVSGFDTYLYLYNSNFQLVSSNDDSIPPGKGGSRLTAALTGGSVPISGTTFTTTGQASIIANNSSMTLSLIHI